MRRRGKVTTLLGAVVCAAFALLFCRVSAQTPASQPEQITIHADAPARPFPHFWEQMFGSGRAILSLRESYRRDLRTVKSATGLRYIRFHGIFDRGVGIYDLDASGRPVYNWSYLDQIYDGLLANGVRPFVELSFMPPKLAASQTPHVFWYHPLPSPPKSYALWEQLIQNFAQHLVSRYGIDEVSQWYFEVWNEPNLDFWTGKPARATYFELYDHAARAIKRVSPRLRVGGPATAQAAWVGAMIAHAVQNHVPLDFVSTHVYANDTSENVFHTHEAIPRSAFVARAAKEVNSEVKKSALPGLPIIWSEYNASYKNEIEVTDSPFMGPWLANTIRLCDGLTTMMSYWTFSDVFEEQGVVKTPFYGGYGAIAEDGIPKASFNAFAMLHRLGEQRMQPDLTDAIVTKRANGDLAIAVWNYADAGKTTPAKQVQIRVEGWNGTARYRVEVLDASHGSALTAWRAMGRPAFPTTKQIEQLRNAAAATEKLDSANFALSGPGLALVEVTR